MVAPYTLHTNSEKELVLVFRVEEGKVRYVQIWPESNAEVGGASSFQLIAPEKTLVRTRNVDAASFRKRFPYKIEDLTLDET